MVTLIRTSSFILRADGGLTQIITGTTRGLTDLGWSGKSAFRTLWIIIYLRKWPALSLQARPITTLLEGQQIILDA